MKTLYGGITYLLKGNIRYFLKEQQLEKYGFNLEPSVQCKSTIFNINN